MPLQMQRNDKNAAGSNNHGAMTGNRSGKPSKEASPIGTPNQGRKSRNVFGQAEDMLVKKRTAQSDLSLASADNSKLKSSGRNGNAREPREEEKNLDVSGDSGNNTSGTDVESGQRKKNAK